jgi:predicted enzyme related to lactoylglutathione lyase
MAGQPSHIEIGVPDTERGQRFYGELLGWGFEPTEHGARVQTGGLPAGLHRYEGPSSIQVFYEVPDLDEAARMVAELGGEVDEMGEEGESGRWLYSCRDDQGVPFGLHQPPAA